MKNVFTTKRLCRSGVIAALYVALTYVFGSLATLIAALLTYLVGRFCKKDGIKIVLGGLPPVLVNALVIPAVIVFIAADQGASVSIVSAYFINVGAFLLTQSVWVYGLGTPLYFTIKRLIQYNPKFFA